ncbi:MAG TPA: NAD(P)/FAD-dependent oxidoreductase [Candidatus Cloacimonadota bacterium]|nr:NAD(P)/FAD-dependent oxidoreductase [Candidatus Cloacimonadota bacterium]
MIKTDVLIVGGGPAGLSAANAAAVRGVSVLLLEKSREIGYPVHTSGGSWIRELKKLGIPEKFMNPISRVDFMVHDDKATFDFDVPVACVLDVRGLYQHLAEEAALQGATIRINANVIEPILERNMIVGVKAIRNGVEEIIRAKVVIDASGFHSIITRKLGFMDEITSYGYGAEYEIITGNWKPDHVALLFGSHFAPNGYGWIFPCGEHRVRIGTGIIFPETKQDPVRLLDKFMESNDDIARILRPYSLMEVHLGSVPNSGVIRQTYADHFISVGDSAGHVSGIAGEGIRYAIDIGRMAGKVAADAVLESKTNAAFLKQYEALWKKKYEKNFRISHIINQKIRQYTDEEWETRIKMLQKVDKDIVISLMKGNYDVNLVSLTLRKNPDLLMRQSFKLIRKMMGIKS